MIVEEIFEMHEYTNALLQIFMQHMGDAIQANSISYAKWYLGIILSLVSQLPHPYQWMYKQHIKSMLHKHPEIMHYCTHYDI